MPSFREFSKPGAFNIKPLNPMLQTTSLPSFARNKAAFDSALFTGPATFDGYIVRVLKSGGIKLVFRSEVYVLNSDGVFCLATKQSDGRMWYSYGGKLNELSMSALSDLADVVRSLAAPVSSVAAEMRWDDPRLWEGVKQGNCGCGHFGILRNGLCWNCEPRD